MGPYNYPFQLLFEPLIAAVAAEQNYIRPDDVARLIQFRNDPADESWIGGNH